MFIHSFIDFFNSTFYLCVTLHVSEAKGYMLIMDRRIYNLLKFHWPTRQRQKITWSIKCFIHTEWIIQRWYWWCTDAEGFDTHWSPDWFVESLFICAHFKLFFFLFIADRYKYICFNNRMYSSPPPPLLLLHHYFTIST